MVKRHRKVRTAVYVSLEGLREEAFYYFLADLFLDKTSRNVNIDPGRGGNSDVILERAIKNTSYNRSFAWFDEDVSLKETRNKLAKCWGVEKFDPKVADKDLQDTYNKNYKNPILIVSNPCSVEGVILSLFNKLPKKLDTKTLKNSLVGLTGSGHDLKKEIAFYKSHLTKEKLENSGNPTLDLILLIFRDKKIGN